MYALFIALYSGVKTGWNDPGWCLWCRCHYVVVPVLQQLYHKRGAIMKFCFKVILSPTFLTAQQISANCVVCHTMSLRAKDAFAVFPERKKTMR